MNIEGLSEATLEKFIAEGLIKEPADIFRLGNHKDKITAKEGFGEKSFARLADAIERARKTNTVRLLYGLGIPNIGLSNAKLICLKFGYDWDKIQNASYSELISISGIGEIMANAYVSFFSDEGNRKTVADILDEIEFEQVQYRQAI